MNKLDLFKLHLKRVFSTGSYCIADFDQYLKETYNNHIPELAWGITPNDMIFRARCVSSLEEAISITHVSGTSYNPEYATDRARCSLPGDRIFYGGLLFADYRDEELISIIGTLLEVCQDYKTLPFNMYYIFSGWMPNKVINSLVIPPQKAEIYVSKQQKFAREKFENINVDELEKYEKDFLDFISEQFYLADIANADSDPYMLTNWYAGRAYDQDRALIYPSFQMQSGTMNIAMTDKNADERLIFKGATIFKVVFQHDQIWPTPLRRGIETEKGVINWKIW